MLNSLQANRGETKHIIFTPDRMTLQVEEGLFEFLNEQCFFDVDVTTLTRFTNKIVAENNINQRVLTKPECVTIIKKILNENKSEFKTIKKALNFNGFSNTIFETISMFKSCNVTPNQISLNTPNKNLNLKLEDIKLVYQKYEDFLQNDYTDSFNKLNLLTKLIKTQNFKTTHFYFVGFEDFTPLMYNVIKELALNSASVNVACAVSYIDELNNKNIFLNNVYLKIIDPSLLEMHIDTDEGNAFGVKTGDELEIIELEFARPLSPMEVEVIRSWDYPLEILKRAVQEAVTSSNFWADITPWS